MSESTFRGPRQAGVLSPVKIPGKGSLAKDRWDGRILAEKRDCPVCSFDEAYRTFYPRVVRHLTYLLGDRAAAEDLAQETFLKLYTVPPPTWQNLGGWLYRVGARLALNYLRGERRRQKRELEEGETRGAGVIPLEEVIWRQETVRKVRRVLAEMPARDRIALLLRHSGFTYQEIASVLEVMPGSVGALLARAQRRFLEKYRLREGDRS